MDFVWVPILRINYSNQSKFYIWRISIGQSATNPNKDFISGPDLTWDINQERELQGWSCCTISCAAVSCFYICLLSF